MEMGNPYAGSHDKCKHSLSLKILNLKLHPSLLVTSIESYITHNAGGIQPFIHMCPKML